MGEDKKFIVVKKSITSFLDDKFGSKLQRVRDDEGRVRVWKC